MTIILVDNQLVAERESGWSILSFKFKMNFASILSEGIESYQEEISDLTRTSFIPEYQICPTKDDCIEDLDLPTEDQFLGPKNTLALQESENFSTDFETENNLSLQSGGTGQDDEKAAKRYPTSSRTTSTGSKKKLNKQDNLNKNLKTSSTLNSDVKKEIKSEPNDSTESDRIDVTKRVEFVDITNLDKYTTNRGDCLICNRRFSSE